MLRSTVSKVMWVGRATVFLVGLAVVVALMFGLASMALGGNGKPSIPGQKGTASKESRLINNGAGPALDPGPPLAVNPLAKAAELDSQSRRLRLRCPTGRRLIGRLCFDVNPRAANTVPNASDECHDLGGRLPGALQLRSIRGEPGIDLGASTPTWSADLQHLGTATPPNDLAAVAVFDSGGVQLRDDQELLPFRCVYQPLAPR